MFPIPTPSHPLLPSIERWSLANLLEYPENPVLSATLQILLNLSTIPSFATDVVTYQGAFSLDEGADDGIIPGFVYS